MYDHLELKKTPYGYYWSYGGSIVSDLFDYKHQAYQWVKEKAKHKTY